MSPLVISKQHSGIIVKKEITRKINSLTLNELIFLTDSLLINVKNKKIENRENPSTPVKTYYKYWNYK